MSDAAESEGRAEAAGYGSRDAIDAGPRRQALDPDRSFIVEAPAGSGKTELLIQRYLRLLAGVERPEQIVAITFTRKAAAEMRERVVATLEAVAGSGTEGTVPTHRRASIELAQAALSHARRMDWSLIDQPDRLRIMTIDALNTGLARQLPILANGIASLKVADDTSEIYALAARRTTESLAEDGPIGEALGQLLAGADNSLGVLEERLAGSLGQRDRWLRALTREGSAADSVTRALERLAAGRLAAVRQLAGTSDEQRVLEMLGPRADIADDSGKPLPATGEQAVGEAEAYSIWRAAGSVFLTGRGEWRRRLTAREGFPPDDKTRRDRALTLLEDLKGRAGLRESLAALAALPPLEPGAGQARQLAAIELVLPRLLAELRVLFEENGAVDHTELSLAAQQALGAVDVPSDLLLALDRRIEHILVDEFQDTSRLQWRLLEHLTSGWQAGDGRTLFLVGDPMQSIYRFRDADLSLFLRARNRGLGSVELTPIELRENHRSAREVVAWVNSTFAPVFPAEDRIESLAPHWRPSVSTRPRSADARVELTVLAGERHETEIARVVDIVGQELERAPRQSIGILVRSRTHLAGLRAALARAGVSAHAVEIDSLTDTQLGQDLIGLTQALTHQGDRLAWLGLLRSPWCGLGWADLLALCGEENEGQSRNDPGSERTIRERLADPVCRARLSDEGRRRAEWLAERLEHAFSLRATRPFGRWLRETWRLIDGPAALADTDALEIAESYFAGLGQLARDGDVDDPAELRRRFSNPAATDAPLESGVEIMTMHRAKGLEFDCVILPGLGRVVRGSESKLLYNLDLDSPDADELGLLAAAVTGPDPIVDYIAAIDREREAAERGRLLYVAATRARTRLYLTGSVDPKSGSPRGGSLLATLWPGLGETAPAAAAETAAEPDPAGLVSIEHRRLDFDHGLPAAALPLEGGDDGGRPEFEWVHPASVQVGTLIHRELQRLAEAGARAGSAVPPVVDIDRYRRELALLGVEREDLTAAAGRVAKALANVFDDRVGRWILAPRREAWTELRLTLRDRGGLEHVQLDRSFVDDDGTRWIIDYKTGRHLGGEIEAFLDAEVDRYRGQLERYASAVAATETRPIRVGLYFPLMTELRSWEPAGPGTAG